MIHQEVIELIKKNIKDNFLQDAQNGIYSLISELDEDYVSDTYHECLYLLGIINTKKFEETGFSEFSHGAHIHFVTANNYYLALHNENSDIYMDAIKYIQNTYRYKNTKITKA